MWRLPRVGAFSSWRCVNTVAHQLRRASCLRSLSQVPVLPSWDLNQFKTQAFDAAKPYTLPFDRANLAPACKKWFIHDSDELYDLNNAVPQASELRTAFWSNFEETIVPLELTSKHPTRSEQSFQRSEVPLKLLLAYLATSLSSPTTPLPQQHSVYLAQCSLSSLPESLRTDVPIPSLVTEAGRGDLYDSSLWLGRPPTYTPLHRDPNPNLFLQLGGRKVVRLFPPDVGNVIFEHVQQQLQATSSRTGGPVSSALRGEEMMAGPEREILHDVVWNESLTEVGTLVKDYGQEVEVGLGQALFIPKGWWHSIKGIGKGITASVNWWFR